jgi:hypothetical protein
MKLPLSQIVTFPPDTPIHSVEVTIKKVEQAREVTGNYGLTSFQDVLVADGPVEFPCTFVAREKIDQSFVNKRYIFLSKDDGKGKLTGVKTKQAKARGNIPAHNKLWITDTASVVPVTNFSHGAPTTHHAPPQSQPAYQPPLASYQPPPPQAQARSPHEASHNGGEAGDSVAKAWQYLERMGNFYQLALRQGVIQKGEYKKITGQDMMDEQFRAMVSSFVIQAERAAIPQTLPVGDISKYLENL